MTADLSEELQRALGDASVLERELGVVASSKPGGARVCRTGILTQFLETVSEP